MGFDSLSPARPYELIIFDWTWIDDPDDPLVMILKSHQGWYWQYLGLKNRLTFDRQLSQSHFLQRKTFVFWFSLHFMEICSWGRNWQSKIGDHWFDGQVPWYHMASLGHNGQHYNDSIMGGMASQITRLTIVYSPFIQTTIKENIKAPRHWPLCGEFTRDWWIPARMASTELLDLRAHTCFCNAPLALPLEYSGWTGSMPRLLKL